MEILKIGSHTIAEIKSEETVINSPQDALDLMAEAGYYGAASLILGEMNLCPEFFELRTGMAGEILLKFSNYRMKLAVIGEFGEYTNKNLRAFIDESNRGNQIFFVPNRDTALAKIVGR